MTIIYHYAEGRLKAGIRPEHIELTSKNKPGAIRMQISMLENTGREVAVFLAAPGMSDLTIISNADFPGQLGHEIYVCLKWKKIHIFNVEKEWENVYSKLVV